MKIGILTLPFNNNYGGLLQAYALQSYLKERGHDVWIIKRIINKSGLVQKTKKNIKKLLFSETVIIDNNMKAFEKKYIRATEIIDIYEKYNLLNNYEFDSYVVGSDQVWRFDYTKLRKNEYFFSFISSDTIKRVAFAASFGIDSWRLNKQETKTITSLISKFDAVSVREKCAIDLCRKYLNYNNAIHLLDPTLLHSINFYRSLYNGTEIDHKGEMGVFILDPTEQKYKQIIEFKNNLNISSFYIGKQSSIVKDKICFFYPAVSQWVKDFDTAKCIITDSFHGIIFSMIFKKPFYVFGNISRGISRLSSFLETFDLQDRLISTDTSNNLNHSELFFEMDHKHIDNVISKNIANSDTFLTNIKL